MPVSAAVGKVMNDLAVSVVNLRAADVGPTLRAMHKLGDGRPGVRLMAAFAEHHGAIGIGELDHMVVEDFAKLLFAVGAPALSLSGFGIVVLDPIDHVEIVD